MSVLNKLREIITNLEECAADAGKFDKGNASAGVRTRKLAQDCVVALKELRKLVSDARRERQANK
jgi:hypothetical protein